MVLEQSRDRDAEYLGYLRQTPGADPFVPFSYFCTCWNVTPILLARAP